MSKPPCIDLSVRQAVPTSPLVQFGNQLHSNGSVTGLGTQPFFSPKASCTVACINFQLLTNCSIQLLLNGVAISPLLALSAGSIGTFPGLLIPNNAVLSFSLSVNASINFDVIYQAGIHPSIIETKMTVSQNSVTIPTNFFSLMASLPNVSLKPCYTSQTGLAAGTTVDVYTVPVGRRAILMQMTLSNATGATASTFAIQIKIAGTYWRAALSNSIAAGTGNTLNGSGSLSCYIAEAGEGFSITQTTAGAVWQSAGTIIEFDNTAAIRFAKIFNLVIGDNKLYTPPGTLNGFVTYSPAALLYSFLPQFGNVIYIYTTGAPALFLNYLRNGAAASTNNRITPSGSLSSANILETTGIWNTSPVSIGVANGDALSINSSAAVTGFFGCTVIEF